ncbi:MAG TPA: hypothetical protein VM032_10275 [Vicinamibacterales bacterium]|nr:hypothetical protein [Vicinamibacterales bacterium]
MSTTAPTPAPAPDRSDAAPAGEAPVVLDFGKHKRKAIKRLREGSGRLLDDVQTAIEDLRAAGAISATAQPVIIVVREKRRRSSMLPGF